jgi:hypothetical protein
MTCDEARDLFSDRLDDRLGAGPRARLEEHLGRCPACAREWERFSGAVALLRAQPAARAPAGFAERTLEAARRPAWPRRLLRGLFLPLHVKVPLEAAALVLVSVLVLLVARQPEVERLGEPPSPPAAVAPATEEQEAPATPAPPAAAEGRVAKERDLRDEAIGRQERAREALKSAAPREAAPSRSLGPFHLMGLLQPRDPPALDAQLARLVKDLDGILVRDADRVGPGSLVEVVLPREALPRLEAGLGALGDFRVQTRARELPDRVRVGLRIGE